MLPERANIASDTRGYNDEWNDERLLGDVGHGIGGLLTLVVVVLAAAALAKYLFFNKRQ